MLQSNYFPTDNSCFFLLLIDILKSNKKKGELSMYGYENAASGLKKMFTAQVGSIICVVLILILIRILLKILSI